jgi:hypothetical protein
MFNPRIYGAVRKKTFSEREKELCNYDKSTYYRVMGLTALTWLIIGLVWGFVFFSYKTANAQSFSYDYLHGGTTYTLNLELNDGDVIYAYGKCDIASSGQTQRSLEIKPPTEATTTISASISHGGNAGGSRDTHSLFGLYEAIETGEYELYIAEAGTKGYTTCANAYPLQIGYFSLTDLSNSGGSGENGGTGGDIVIDYPYEYEDWLYVEMWKVYSLAVIGLGVVLSPFKLM